MTLNGGLSRESRQTQIGLIQITNLYKYKNQNTYLKYWYVPKGSM